MAKSAAGASIESLKAAVAPNRPKESFSPELNLDAASTVGTVRSVNASVRKHEALYWNAADEVRLDNFFYIFLLDEAVPNRFGIDSDCRPVLALIETP